MASSSAAPPTMVSAVEATRPSRPSAHLSLIKQVSRARTSYVLLAPFFLLFSTFVVIPIVLSGYLSLQDYSGTKAPVFIGLENFAELMSLDIKPLPQATDKTSGELLYKCGTKQVPQSQADQLRASGASCTAVMARPGLVLAKGYQELARFVVPFTNTMLIIGASDTRFWISLWNTIKYSLVVVPIGIYLGLALALVLQRQNPLNFFLRTVFFLPSVTSTLAVITIWRYIFNSDSYGLANGFLTSLSFPKQTFLADATWTVPVMIIFALWGGVGYNMLLFLAGLQSIPRDYYDAAAIDGASVAAAS